jgi:Beta-propeller repeat
MFGISIAVDSAGNAHVVGLTNSLDFPTANAIQPTYGGVTDGFVTKFNPTGSAFVYSTYLGGTGSDSANGIAVDSVGDAYVTEGAGSADFPTVNAIQPTNQGSR